MNSSQSIASIMRRMTVVLLIASVASILISVPLFFTRSPFWVGVAWQFSSWGLIDLVFAAFGLKRAAKSASASPAEQHAEADKLRRTLLFNQKLNYLWVGGSLAVLIAAWPMHSIVLAGHGVGATLQALLLYGFDKLYVANLTRAGVGGELATAA